MREKRTGIKRERWRLDFAKLDARAAGEGVRLADEGMRLVRV